MTSAAKILLVDDEGIILADLEERLTRMGHRVVGLGTSGEEAVVLAGSLKPDLVVMDIMMPGAMDGIAAADRIRGTLGVPTVFLTAYADRSTIERAKAAVPLGYILKPFQESQLYSTVEIALYNRKIERRLQDSEARYRAVVENQSDLICRFLPDFQLDFFNSAFRRFFSLDPAGKSPRCFSALFSGASSDALQSAVEALDAERPIQQLEVSVETPEGRERHLHWIIHGIFGPKATLTEYQAVGRDVTERVEAEAEIHRLNQQLEWRVQNRTRDLEAKSRRLKETNIALEVLLQRREEDRIELERNLLHSVKELIEPTILQLRLAASDSARSAFLDILEANMAEIVSPFARKLSDHYTGLTAQEIQVANLVRQGRTAKETAAIMGLSVRTIDTYRTHIRKKLGLDDRRTRLQAYLKSLG
ncbi:MAG: response regulator [Desulfobacterales bacterium]